MSILFNLKFDCVFYNVSNHTIYLFIMNNYYDNIINYIYNNNLTYNI